MKKGIYIVIALLMAVTIFLPTTGCDPGLPTYVGVSIVQEPVGGYNINSLNCSYSATWRFEEGDPNITYDKSQKPDVTVTAVWVNDQGGEYNEKRISLGEDYTNGTFTISNAPKSAGLYFDKTFWVRITWQDSAGSHTVTSSKAICKVK